MGCLALLASFLCGALKTRSFLQQAQFHLHQPANSPFAAQITAIYDPGRLPCIGRAMYLSLDLVAH